MLDRQKLETVLTRRFAGAPLDQIASAANAIMGLDDEWEEVSACSHRCLLAREEARDAEFRLLRRRLRR